jgi:HD-like signal output (HDOD) protein
MAETLRRELNDGGVLRERVRETLTRLSRTGALPALPQAATTALSIARDPDADADRLCKVIETDVGLAARVLRVANSVAYGRRRPATTLHAAVVTVGLRRTCDILVAASARQLYGSTKGHAERLWNHALATAIAASELARVTRSIDPHAAFLPGLFHDVGHIAFLLADRDSYEVVYGLTERQEGVRTDLEREWYGFDHAEAGAILSLDWGLSDQQCDAIRWHHEVDKAEAGRSLATLLNAADAIAYAIGCGSSGRMPAGVSTAAFGLSPEAEAECVERVRAAYAETQSLFV